MCLPPAGNRNTSTRISKRIKSPRPSMYLSAMLMDRHARMHVVVLVHCHLLPCACSHSCCCCGGACSNSVCAPACAAQHKLPKRFMGSTEDDRCAAAPMRISCAPLSTGLGGPARQALGHLWPQASTSTNCSNAGPAASSKRLQQNFGSLHTLNLLTGFVAESQAL